jgi:hypothetical protein
LTVDLMPLAEWTEVAWLKLGEARHESRRPHTRHSPHRNQERKRRSAESTLCQ